MSTPVQTVPLNVIRTNLDGTTLPNGRKAWALYEQAVGLAGALAPLAIASATWVDLLTVVTVFDGEKEIAYYCDEDTFDYWKDTFEPPTTFGNPDPVDGTMYEIYAVRIPGAPGIAGKCAANP